MYGPLLVFGKSNTRSSWNTGFSQEFWRNPLLWKGCAWICSEWRKPTFLSGGKEAHAVAVERNPPLKFKGKIALSTSLSPVSPSRHGCSCPRTRSASSVLTEILEALELEASVGQSERAASGRGSAMCSSASLGCFCWVWVLERASLKEREGDRMRTRGHSALVVSCGLSSYMGPYGAKKM